VQWLRRCEAFHPKCSVVGIADPPLPTRLLDVGSDAQDSPVRLVETAGLVGKYLCLSYCWSAANALMSTRQTVQQWIQEIPWSALPQTLKDAVSFVRRLGHCYIWIDALCIIEDDKDDSNREALKMASIYRN
jgi:hypothetical protein